MLLRIAITLFVRVHHMRRRNPGETQKLKAQLCSLTKAQFKMCVPPSFRSKCRQRLVAPPRKSGASRLPVSLPRDTQDFAPTLTRPNLDTLHLFSRVHCGVPVFITINHHGPSSILIYIYISIYHKQYLTYSYCRVIKLSGYNQLSWHHLVDPLIPISCKSFIHWTQNWPPTFGAKSAGRETELAMCKTLMRLVSCRNRTSETDSLMEAESKS